MNWEEVVSNVNIYGLEETVQGSAYPVDEAVEKPGNGHDSFLNGIIVQLDLTFSNKAWVEAERFHFLDFVSTQSAMNRITKFDLDHAYIQYTDPRIVGIMKEKVREYNTLQEEIRQLQEEGKDVTTLNDVASNKYLEIIYSNPAGFRLTARMTTNYRQLRMIYRARKGNRLPEWKAFCAWVETLPYNEYLIEQN